jgi:hypothetical protein
LRVVSVEYPQDQGVLLLRRQVPYPCGQLCLGGGGVVVACAVSGGDCEEVLVEADEVDEAAERRVQGGQVRRDGWFDLVIVEFAGPDRVQPGQVEEAQVAGGEVGAGADDRGESSLAVLLDPVGLVQAHYLFVLAIAVDGGLLDQRVELCPVHRFHRGSV